MAPNRERQAISQSPDQPYRKQPVRPAPELQRFLKAINGTPKSVREISIELSAPTHTIFTWITNARGAGFIVRALNTKPTTFEFVPPRPT